MLQQTRKRTSRASADDDDDDSGDTDDFYDAGPTPGAAADAPSCTWVPVCCYDDDDDDYDFFPEVRVCVRVLAMPSDSLTL
jgi:hypothetical protein